MNSRDFPVRVPASDVQSSWAADIGSCRLWHFSDTFTPLPKQYSKWRAGALLEVTRKNGQQEYYSEGSGSGGPGGIFEFLSPWKVVVEAANTARGHPSVYCVWLFAALGLLPSRPSSTQPFMTPSVLFQVFCFSFSSLSCCSNSETCLPPLLSLPLQ